MDTETTAQQSQPATPPLPPPPPPPPAQGGPTKEKWRPRYQPKPPPPPTAMSRSITLWLVMTAIAIVNASVGPANLQGLNLWLTTIPVYVVCAVLLRGIAVSTVAVIKGGDDARRECRISSALKVRNLRCYALITMAKDIFVRCVMGVAAAGYVMIMAARSSSGVPAVLDALASLLFLLGGLLMFVFSGIFVACAMVPIVPLILHLLDFIEAQPDLAPSVPGRPLPGTPAARRWVLGLRRITGFILYGSFGWLIFCWGCAALDQGLIDSYSGSLLELRIVIQYVGHTALLASGVCILAVVPLTLLQLVLVAACFCRFSLRGIFLLQFGVAALVTLAVNLPDAWKALPILALLIVLTYTLFYITGQDPENAVYFTPDFVRQRIIQRRQQFRDKAKALALADAQRAADAAATPASPLFSQSPASIPPSPEASI